MLLLDNYMSIHNLDRQTFSEEELERMKNIRVSFKDEEALNEYKICIPKAYAREESDEYLRNVEDIEKVPHYEIYIERQIGSTRNRRDTYLYLRLPKSSTLVTIILYMDGGVGFDPKFHKLIIRELDEIDRRVILGFCLKYESTLLAACYAPEKRYKDTLQIYADLYRMSEMPKRLKTGSLGYDMTSHYGKLEPYEESPILYNVSLI